MDSNDLTIVIVTFNSELKIADCLKSIEDKAEIIVVENSNNETFKKNLENQYRNLKCILTGGNKGYAVANNIGLKSVKTNYALVLNPDTILDKNAIHNFLISAKKNDDFWLIGPASDQMVDIKFEANKLVEVNNIKAIIIGNPINMDGSQGKSSQSVKDIANNIYKSINLPICLWDERLSTVAAFNLSSQLDINVSKREKDIDKNAATFILQGAIDYLNN